MIPAKNAYQRVAVSEDVQPGKDVELVATSIADHHRQEPEMPVTWEDDYFDDGVVPDVQAVFDHYTPVEREAVHYVFWTESLSIFTGINIVTTLMFLVGDGYNRTVATVCVALVLATCFLRSQKSAQAFAWYFTSAPVFHTALTLTGLRLVQQEHQRQCTDHYLMRWPSSFCPTRRERPRVLCDIQISYERIRSIEIVPVRPGTTPEILDVQVNTTSTDETDFVLRGIPTHAPCTFSSYLDSDPNWGYQRINLYGLVEPYRFKKMVKQRLRRLTSAEDVPSQRGIVRADAVVVP